MTIDTKVHQGTAAWFEMVGTMMSEAAAKTGLAPDLNVSFVERYTDGAEMSHGLYQGIRFDIANGKPTFRVGVTQNEHADATVEVTPAAARRLNELLSTEPAYQAAREKFLSTGEMRVDGNPSRLGQWLDAVHDPIVNRTD